jgi:hypothetical protein
MPINPTSQAAGVDGDAVIDAAVSAHKTPEKFAHARGVFLVDPATGLPAAPAGTSGDASAANQLTEIARLEAIRDRLPSFSLPAYDHMTLGYTGSDLTSVTYRSGGAGGTVVATLTLGYSGGNLVTIARS